LNASVIIPTYNRADVIIRALETWTKQNITGDEFEVIIVDNNSTDTTAELVRRFVEKYPNFKYLKEQKAGSTNARHAGVRIAKSEVLIFADDDGLFNENCIEEIVNVYQSNTEVDAVAGKIEILWDKKPPEWIAPYEFMLGKLDYGDKVVVDRDIFLNGGLFSIKKNVFNKLHGFNPDLIGDYLVGDGDTGLVIKLHNNKHLIGWTPYAQMQHMQFVDKQGTVKDMGRRFYNVGISTSYGKYRAEHFKWNFSVTKSVIKSMLFFVKKLIEYYLFRKKERKVFFSLMQRKGELAFFVQLSSNEVRESLKEEQDSFF